MNQYRGVGGLLSIVAMSPDDLALLSPVTVAKIVLMRAAVLATRDIP